MLFNEELKLSKTGHPVTQIRLASLSILIPPIYF